MIAEAMDKVRTFFQASMAPVVVTNRNGGTDTIALVPKDYTAITLASKQVIPATLEQNVTFQELDSFASYVSRFGTDEGTVIFLEVDEDENSIGMAAVLDYHKPISAEDVEAFKPPPGTAVLPQWGKHIARFAPVMTPEWKLWTGSNKKGMEQIIFAHFLEDNYPDIVNPVAADLIQTCRSLELVGNVHYVKAFREHDGQVSLQYKEENKPNGQIVVPEEITLRLVPFRGESSVDVQAKLRYRLQGGVCTFAYELVRPHKVLDACATEMREQIAVLTAKRFPIYAGSAH